MLLNLKDYIDYKNWINFEPVVDNLGDGLVYYYSSVSDNYYYEKQVEFTTDNLNIAQNYNNKPGSYVEYNEKTKLYEIEAFENTVVTNPITIQRITEEYNKLFESYKKMLEETKPEYKQKKWFDEYEKKACSVNDIIYDDTKTQYTFDFDGLKRTIFIDPVKRMAFIFDDTWKLYQLDKKTPNVPGGVFSLLKQKIDQYKKKLDDDKKKIKDKELEKLNKDNSKPNEIETKKIEEQPDNPNNKKLKENIKEENDKNKKEVEENKPKLVIKIPKPFAMGYFIIDLSALLAGLLGILSSFALGLLMSKLADLLKSLLSYDMTSKSKINASKINNALNSINLSEVINEVLDEENVMKLNKTLKESDITSDLNPSKTPSEQFFDTRSNMDDTGNYINDDVSITTDLKITPNEKTNINKLNQKREIFTMNRRGRIDLLNSTEANERLNNNSTNKKTVYNKNYGRYW